jgi:hypothetical protein
MQYPSAAPTIRALNHVKSIGKIQILKSSSRERNGSDDEVFFPETGVKILLARKKKKNI